MSEEHKKIKPFDHKPDKYNAEGKVIRRESYGCHVVNGGKFYYLYSDPGKFYTEGGHPIPFEQVPDECKRNLNKPLPKGKEVAGRIVNSGSEAKEPASLV
jgi:hypothetical protein